MDEFTNYTEENELNKPNLEETIKEDDIKRNKRSLKSLDLFFQLSERNTNVKTELLAGLTTFLSMAYILAVNSGMLALTGMPLGACYVSTLLAAVIATLIMGLYANYPVALASGMGLNSFFTFTVCIGMGFTYQEALLSVFFAGILLLILSISGLRKIIINGIPQDLKYAVGAGIGLFIAYIGLLDCGIVEISDGFPKLGAFNTPGVLLAIFGILLCITLYSLNLKGKLSFLSKFSLIISMLFTALLGSLLYAITKLDSLPHYSMSNYSYAELYKIKDVMFDCFSALPSFLKLGFSSFFVIITFLFLDFFDTAGTLLAVGSEAGLIDEKGELKDGTKTLYADSIGTITGAMLGTSPVTTFVESGTGVQAGGKTGLTSITVAILFLLALLAFPLLGFVTYSVVAPALVMVGIMMITQLKKINFDDYAVVISTFFILLFMVITYSISNGIAVGFLVYPIVMLCQKRYKEVHPIMYGLAIFFILYFTINGLYLAGVIK